MVLFHIHNVANKSWSYRVHKNGISLLLNLFNGNVVFPYKYNQLLDCIASFNDWASRGPIILAPILAKAGGLMPLKDQDNAWLSGLTDAKVVFHVVSPRGAGENNHSSEMSS